jgi:hypothetical protein
MRNGKIVHSHPRQAWIDLAPVKPPLDGIYDMFRISAKVLVKFVMEILGSGSHKAFKVIEDVSRLRYGRVLATQMVRCDQNETKNIIYLLDIFYLNLSFGNLIRMLIFIPDDLLGNLNPFFCPIGLSEIL